MGQRGTIKIGHYASRTQLVMLGGVSIVALSVGIRLLSSGPQSAPAATVTAPIAHGAPLAATTPLHPANHAINVTWPNEIARDPFHSNLVFPPAPPPPEPVVEAPVLPPAPPPVDIEALAKETIHLKGTVLGDRPLAMMNGRVYRVGEVVEGFEIVKIGINQITIERDGLRLIVQVQ